MNFWERIIEWSFYLTLFVSVLFLGAGFAGGYTLLEAFILILVTNLILYRTLLGLRVSSWTVKLPFILLTAWIFFLGFQLLPLPSGWVRIISPRLVQLLETFSPSVAMSSAWIPSSLGSYRMWVEVGKALTYVTIFVVTYLLMENKERFKHLNISIIFIGFFVSSLGLFFYRLGIPEVYGIFSFDRLHPSFTPYINKNHFANLIVMTIPMTLAYIFLLAHSSALSSRPSIRTKVLWFASREATWLFVVIGLFAIQLAALLFTASRGGLFGLVMGLVSFAFLLAFKWSKRSTPLVILGIFAIIVLLSVYQAKPLIYKLKLLQESPAADLAIVFRLSNWKDTFRIFLDFPLVGIGAGAFHQIFPLYKSMPELANFSQVRFYHAENELLEGLAELGIIGTTFLIAFGSVLSFRFLKQWRGIQSKTVHWVSLGAACASVGMLAHSLVDFPMHVPANMALFATFGGILARVGYGEIFSPVALSTKHFSWSSVRLKHITLGLALVITLFAILTPYLWRQWRSEYYYMKAQSELDRILDEHTVSLPPLLSAQEYLLKAKRVGNHQARIYHGLGSVYVYLGLLAQGETSKQAVWFSQGESSLLKALKAEPLNAAYHYTLGWLYGEWGQYQQAVPYLKNASLLEPQNPFYRFQLGKGYLRAGNKQAAQSAFKDAIGINSAYLKPVLEILVVSSKEIVPADLRELLPQADRRKLLQQAMAQFFETRKDYQLAEAVRHFVPEPLHS